MKIEIFVSHLITEEVDMRPEGFKRGDSFLYKAEDAINADLKRFGLQVSGFNVEPNKPEQLHYCVSVWYSDDAYTLIENIIRNYFAKG